MQYSGETLHDINCVTVRRRLNAVKDRHFTVPRYNNVNRKYFMTNAWKCFNCYIYLEG